MKGKENLWTDYQVLKQLTDGPLQKSVKPSSTKQTESLEQWMERSRVRLVDRSVMPREVAIEMLSTPKVKLGGKERRMFRDALVKHFTSTLEEKPREVKRAFKLQHSTWAQLNKWLKRTTVRYFSMQKKYSQFSEKVSGFTDGSPEKKVGESKLSAFGLIIAVCAESLDCLETEVDRRMALATAADKISTEEVAV